MQEYIFSLFEILVEISGQNEDLDILRGQLQAKQIDQKGAAKKLLEMVDNLSFDDQAQFLEFVDWDLVEKLEKDRIAVTIHSPVEMPDPATIKEMMEPWIKIEILTPEEYLGKIIELITERRGQYSLIDTISLGQVSVKAEIPLSEMIVDFYDDLKSLSKGYATMSYELIGFRPGNLVKVDFLVNSKIVAPLSIIAEKNSAEDKGRHICEKLKTLIPRQQIDIAIQAAIGARIIARESIKAYRKDVTQHMYGGDITRRMKLLDKQKAGKKRMKMVGNVEIPQTAFLNVLKK